MKYLSGLVAMLLFTVLPIMGVADEKADKNTEMGGANNKHLNPWIDCGIGAMIFDETSWAAASSNIIWDLGTTAVTSDQSSQDTCNSKKAQTAMYISATYANLEEETVKGQGQHLHAMLDMMGCDASAHKSIINDVRADFREQLIDPAYLEKSLQVKSKAYYGMVKAKINNSYNRQCQII